MGISFNNIVENSRTVSIGFGDGALSVTYKPTSLSPAHLQKINKELNKGEETDPYAVAIMFCSVVTAWNLEGPVGEDEDGQPVIEAGKPVPVEAEYVAWLPTQVIQYIIQEVAEDSAPKGKKSKR